MLKLSHISSGYGKKQVLFDISFEVKQGEIVLLIGSNGSGKSTLLKTIYGLLPIWNCEKDKMPAIEFESEDILGAPPSSLLKKGLLYIPQKNNLFEQLTVKENLEMAGLVLNDRKLQEERMEYALSLFTMLTPHLKKTPMNLSGGERQLLTLAMALLHKPKMILIDEPFTGLSPKNIAFVSNKLRTLCNDEVITILISEQRIKEAVVISQTIIELNLGLVCARTNKSYLKMN